MIFFNTQNRLSLQNTIIPHADQFPFRISVIFQVQQKNLCIYNGIAAIWCWYWKIETVKIEKNVIKKFSIPSTLQFSRILWNLLLCMLSHCVTDFLPHSHYFYGDIRFFLLLARIFFLFIQLSLVSILWHTIASMIMLMMMILMPLMLLAFEIFFFIFSLQLSTLSLSHFSLCLTNYRWEVEMMMMNKKLNEWK